ncbi:MAG TPA: hypothetical protein VGP94_01040 [Tepidisphaeraceae bacterium]|jgi:hypothetical protein|nr:hypothetical protein [Tepidisphaeraceae bacterium]
MPQRRGYILLTTLALLVLSSTLLVTLARTSIQRTLEARQSHDDLQRRWGQISCQRALLPHAESILIQQEKRHQRPYPTYRATIQLGPQFFDLTLADEQAKTNVNALLDLTDKPRAESQLRTSFSNLASQIRLRTSPVPTSGPTTRPILPRYLSSFGQIFDSTLPQNLLTPRFDKPAPADLLTLWTDGQLNIRRCSPASLSLLNGSALTQLDVRRLIEARDTLYSKNPPPPSTPFPADPIRRLLTQTQIPPNKANLHLTTTSKSHSLWIIVRDPRRQWYSLEVLDQTDQDHPRSYSFLW